MVPTTWATLVRDMTVSSLFDLAVGGVTDTLERRLSAAFSEAVAFSVRYAAHPHPRSRTCMRAHAQSHTRAHTQSRTRAHTQSRTRAHAHTHFFDMVNS